MAEFSNTRMRIASWLLIYLTAVQPLHPAIAAQQRQLPVVDIATPDSSGISHNYYKSFNIDSTGAVLNNATEAGQSVLAGQLAANPNLNSNSAKLIINEVNSSNSTTLAGKLEVFGQKAEVIIVNPNGLQCNGCSFINTNKHTLIDGNLYINMLQITARGQTPIVNIHAPNSAGISHNHFKSFHVDAPGMVLNNSTEAGQSLLVGQLAANRNFYEGNSAKLIINEVIGSDISELTGKLEVFGQKADVIIANPNGVYCNGCNFSHASGITLTTGKPVLNSQGELDSLNITADKAIAVGHKGLNALDQNKVALISRGLKLDGEIRANHLDVILGTNQVGYQNGDIQTLLQKGIKPIIALDTKELGGMYANSIRLISTEKANIVNAKNIVSHKGDITLDVAGNINLGNITTKKDLNITSKNTTLATGSKLLSGRDITLVNTEFNNLGQVTAEGDLRIFSDQVRNNGQQAQLIANNNMWIQKDADGSKNTLVENKSATIKTNSGNLIIRTEKLDNSRPMVTAGWQKLIPDSRQLNDYDEDSDSPDKVNITLEYDWPTRALPEKWFGAIETGEWQSGVWRVNTEKSIWQLNALSPAATLYSGNNLYINASQLENKISHIGAAKDIFLTGNDFLNSSASHWVKDEFRYYKVDYQWPDYYVFHDKRLYYQLTETEKYRATVTAGGNIALDFNNNIKLQRPVPEVDKTAPLSLSEFTPPVLKGHNILLHGKSISSSDLMQANGDITFIAEDSIALANSRLRGQDISLTALNDIHSSSSEFFGRNILLLSREGDVKTNSPDKSSRQPDDARVFNRIKASQDFTAIAGKDIQLTNTLIHPAANISLSAGHDINISHILKPEGILITDGFLDPEKYLNNINQLLSLSNRLTSSGDITLNAGNNLMLQGIKLNAGQDINLHATRDIELEPYNITVWSDFMERYNKVHQGSVYYNIFPRSQTPDYTVQINAKGNALINAGRDILTRGSNINADNHLTLLAGQHIQLAALPYTGTDWTDGSRYTRHAATRLKAGNTLNVVANHQFITQGAELAAGGDMTLTSGGDMRFESVLNEDHYGGGDNSSYRKLQQSTQLNSGGILTLMANGSILFQATQLVAKKVMDIAAEGGYLFAQAMEETSHAEQRWNTRKWWGRKKSHHNVHHVATNKVTEFTSDGDISLLSRDDSTYQASKIAAGQNAKLTSTHGKVIFEAVKDSTFEQKTTLSKGFYIKHTDKGYLDEKWVLPTIQTGGELTVDAAQGIRADVKVKNSESLRNAITALSKTPGNEWLNDLNLRDDVQWQKVMDAYHRWDHKNEQLNPVVAVVIAIAVAAATAGSGLVVAASAAAGGGMAGGAVSAGMSALASQAAVSLMNNKGNISQTFKDLGRKESVKSLVTSMAVGGALSGFDAAMGWDRAAQGAKTASSTSARLPQLSHGDWSKVAQRVAGQSIISSSLNTGINGGSFKENLATALLSSAGSQLHAEGANLIGNNGEVLGVSGKALSHALVAGIAAEIGGGDAKGAAAGALAAELAGAVMGDNFIGSQNWQEKQAQLSRVAGAIAGVLVSGKVEGAYSGADAAEVVERFNRQLHLAEIKAVNELAKGNNVKQERLLAASCRQLNCTAQESLDSAERARAESLMAKYPQTPEEDGILRNYWIQKEKKRFGNYPALTDFEQIQLFTYTDADKLSDSQIFAKNQWVEEASNLTGWSREAVEALGVSASLAGVVRGKRFGQTGAAYPTGISFNINQKNHLANFDGFTQKTGIKGAHNADEFYTAANQHHVKIISATPGSVKGITQITYQIPAYDRAGKVIGYKAAELPKTIYDPKVFTDQKMLDLGQRASAIGYKDAMISKNGTANAIVEGITFRIYVDKNTGMVRNFHPQ
ncbi:TPA: contact-dependent inhibition toxin CdiA [Yersinia enterocolitica]|nr:contact-dependent inhibition toxin CdiA [Yersinia enterocolitica]HDL7833027.1 contact-dependent inhibition toxin CdiA [Yersinia enterocolitica]HDL7873721.1 contact-dependent inhibition toxin CdiA [Yersinia enterocolitica]HDL7886325.1 contact-dependent inhibition toxin CdiA [Yersinia enterocolitica]HDL7894380.1 contact-dependent inhibition toxin CdiA [Yersinia enterocolitica]